MRELSYSTAPPVISTDAQELKIQPNTFQKTTVAHQGWIQGIKSLIFVFLLGVASVGLLFLALGVVAPTQERLDSDSER